MSKRIHRVRTYYPLYSQTGQLLAILGGLPKATVHSMIQAIWDQRGTPQSQADWSDPDTWIPQRLSGELAKLARHIWLQSNRTINPRYIEGDDRFINDYALAVSDDAGAYLVTERGRAFLDSDPQILQE